MLRTLSICRNVVLIELSDIEVYHTSKPLPMENWGSSCSIRDELVRRKAETRKHASNDAIIGKTNLNRSSRVRQSNSGEPFSSFSLMRGINGFTFEECAEANSSVKDSIRFSFQYLFHSDKKDNTISFFSQLTRENGQATR